MPDTTTTTTTNEPDRKAIVSLVGAVGILHETHERASVTAFNTICDNLAEHASAINDLYVPMNEAWQGAKTKTPRPPMSFRRWYDGVSAACKLLKVNIPEQSETRHLFTFVRQGNSQAMRDKFLRVVSLTGEYDLTFREYVRFLGAEGDYTKSGKLTPEATTRRANAEAERERQAAIRKAAESSRPLAYDFTSAAPADVRDDVVKLTQWAMLLRQDLDVFINEKVKTLSDAQSKRVANAVAREVKAHAVR